MIVAFLFTLQVIWMKVILGAASGNQASKLNPSLGTCSEFSPRNQKDEKALARYVDNLDMDGLNDFVTFFGMGRTGHSWIGTVLDASPNAMVANEFNALEYFYQNKDVTREELIEKLAGNSYLCGLYGRVQVYNYTIPGLWQGRAEKLEVIGDKKGRGSITALEKMGKKPWLFPSHAAGQKALYNAFMNRMQLQPKNIIVLRNPFNMISTYALRHGPSKSYQWLEFGLDVIWPSRSKQKPKVKDSQVDTLVDTIKNAMWAKDNLGESHQWHLMTMEAFATNTTQELRKMCSFTNIKCPDIFMDKVLEQTHHNSHDTWHMASWTQSQVDKVNELIVGWGLSEYYSPKLSL